MIYTLENENIRVVASSNGGELHSIKKINDETEYLWNGDERYWKYHAPVLFPIVGKVNGGKYKDYYFEFDKVEKSSKILLNSNGLFTKNKELFMENSKELPLSIEIFKDDAIVFNDLKSNKISLKSRKSDKSVTMDFSGFPYLGLWTKPTGEPFVCIEPWFGHADYEDFNGDFKDKEGINKLAVGKSFKAAYLVTVQ